MRGAGAAARLASWASLCERNLRPSKSHQRYHCVARCHGHPNDTRHGTHASPPHLLHPSITSPIAIHPAAPVPAYRHLPAEFRPCGAGAGRHQRDMGCGHARGARACEAGSQPVSRRHGPHKAVKQHRAVLHIRRPYGGKARQGGGGREGGRGACHGNRLPNGTVVASIARMSAQARAWPGTNPQPASTPVAALVMSW